MKTIYRALALVAVSLLGFAQSPTMTVADTVKIAISGQNAVGSMSLSWPSFTTSDGTYVAGGTQSIRLTNGAFTVGVFPTAGATPTTGGTLPVYYNVRYTLTSGATLAENWSVPNSGGTLKISNVLVPVPPTLQGPSGPTLPQHCTTGQFFMAAGVQNVCVSPETWAALETGAQAASLFVAAPGGNGIPYISGPTSSRLATANDLTGLLGYTPTNPANALSEYSASAPAARNSLGLGTSATHPASDFLFSNILGAPNGAATLDNSGKIPSGQLPALTALGNVNLSQIVISGTPAANKFLNSQNGWAQVDYSQIANAPTVPTDDSQIANSAGYAKSANLAAVATSGRYTDLLNLPTYGNIVTHSDSDFVPAGSKDQPNGVAGLGAGGKIAASELPQIDATTGVSGLGTAAFQNANAFLSASLPGANLGLAQLDNTGKLLASQLPAISYSVLTNTPTIPTKLSQLANDSNFITVANLAAVAVSGSYADLSNKPSLNFDPAGTAASLVTGLLKASSNLSDLTDVTAARTSLGLATVAHSGAYADLSGRPTLSAVAASGLYDDLLNKPTIPVAYVLPTASNLVLGGVKIGANITRDVDGTINVAAPYTLPFATTSALGGVIVGNGLNIDAGTHVLSVNTALFDPAGAATTAVAGVLRAANNLSDLGSIATAKTNLGLSTVASSGSYNDLLNKPTIPAAYTLPTASNTVLGGVKIGANLTEDVDGTINAAAPYALPGATNSVLGGVIVGNGLNIDGTTHVLTVNGSLFDPAGAATTAVAGTLRAANNLSDLGSLTTAKTNLGLSSVASTGSYNDLLNKPTIPPAYALPAATTQTLGGIKVGQNLSVAVDGTLSAQNSYVLPVATNSVLGGVIAGSGLNVTSGGILTVDGSLYDPAGAATTATAGLLKASNNLSDVGSVSTAKTNLGLSTVASTGSYNDLQNKPVIPTQYVLPAATDTTLGGVKCGANLTCAPDGTMAAQNSYVLPQATNSVMGGVVVGSGLLMNNTSHALSVDGSLYDAAGAATAANANALQKSANLSDLGSVATAKTNLGLATVATTGSYTDLVSKPVFGTAATHDVTDFILSTTLGAHNGIAQLDGNGLLPLSELPAIPSTSITGLGTIVTHNANEYIPVTAEGAHSGVATLDVNGLLLTSQLPPINYGSLTGVPTFATVATTGAYADLTGKPAGLPPIGSATGDLSGNYPSPRVVAVNGQNMAALGAGILALDASGVPKLATTNQIQGLLGYVPLDAAKNLQDLTSVPNARTNLGLGSMATKDANAYVPDSGADGLMFRTSSTQTGTAVIATRPATATDITNTLGFVPISNASLGTANGIATLDGNAHLTASQLGSVPFTAITGLPSYVLSSAVGVTVAPLVNGLVPSAMVPAPPLATTSTAGTVIVGSDLTVTAGVLAVDATKFDASGTAAGLVAGSLQKSANLSDLTNAATARANLGLAAVASTGSYTDLTNKPALSPVALSGSYLDLSNKPTIPTKVSDLTNDSGFLTSSTLPIATASSPGVVEVGSYLNIVQNSGLLSVNVGSTTGTVAAGNDPRIVHALQDTQLGANSGIAMLDTSGKVQLSEIPQNIPLGYVVGWGTAAQKDIGFFVAQTQLGAALGAAQLDINGKVQLNEIPQNIPYSYITGGPTQYVLPAATSGTLGGVIVGTGLNVNPAGSITVQFGTGANQAMNGSLFGAPNGVATLDAQGHILTTELAGGAAGGVALLDGSGHIPISELPTGVANGLALLNSTGTLLSSEIPTNIPLANIGLGNVSTQAFGYIAGLTSDAQAQINSISAQVNGLVTGTTPNPNLSAFVGALNNSNNQVVNVVVYGDSMSRCWGAAGNSSSDCPGTGPQNESSLWVNQLTSYLQGKYGSHGSGIMTPISGLVALAGGSWTSNGTFNNGWETFGGVSPGQSGGAPGGGGISLLPGTWIQSKSVQGDTLRIYYATFTPSGAGSGSANGFSLQVDGSPLGSYGQEIDTNCCGTRVMSITPSSGLGNHVTKITCNANANSGARCYIYGIEWTIGSKGVSVHNLALAAARSDAYAIGNSSSTGTSIAPMGFSDLIAGGHQLDIVALGTNDYLGGNLTAFTTNLNWIIQHEKGIGVGNIMILGEPWANAGSASGAQQSQFFSADSTAASNNGLDYDDAPGYFQSASAEGGNGYLNSDGIHFSDLGQTTWATHIEGHIFGSRNAGGTGGNGGTGSGAGLPANISINGNGGLNIAANGMFIDGNLTDQTNFGMYGSSSTSQSWRMGIAGPNNASTTPNAWFVFDNTQNIFPMEILPGSDAVFIGGKLLKSDSNGNWVKPADQGTPLQVWGGSTFFESDSAHPGIKIQGSTAFGDGGAAQIELQSSDAAADFNLLVISLGGNNGMFGIRDNNTATAPFLLDRGAPDGAFHILSSGNIQILGSNTYTGSFTAGSCSISVKSGLITGVSGC